MKEIYKNRGKRLLDLFVCVLILPLVLPLMAVVGLAVYVALGKPIFFRQQRPGRGGKAFELIKFRTMNEKIGRDGKPLADSQRLSPFGQFLRSTSLDELPEIMHVLTGQMSLVGPRPLLMEYLLLYTPSQFRRHHVRPGITGWAQVNGRNAITWEQKFELDLWYVENCSLWVDLSILSRTLLSLLKRSDINAHDHATMPKFTGNSQTNPAEG